MTAPPVGRPVTVGGAFADLLRSDRDGFNHRFALARSRWPRLDPAAFRIALVELVAPLVERCEEVVPGSGRRVGNDLYDIALELMGQGRLEGPVRDAWADLLPAVARQLAAQPRRIAGAMLNATWTLSSAPGARATEWITRMWAVAALDPGVDALLRAGQVAAWRCGMAAYRSSALSAAATLEPPVLAAVLDVAPADLRRLAADPWWHPSGAGAGSLVRVGGFRGFGGPFLRPPLLDAAPDPSTGAPVAVDGGERWLLLADAFGSAVLRAVWSTDGAPARPSGPPDRLPPEAAGLVGRPTSWMALPGAVAVTSALSHWVVFLPGVAP